MSVRAERKEVILAVLVEVCAEFEVIMFTGGFRKPSKSNQRPLYSSPESELARGQIPFTRHQLTPMAEAPSSVWKNW
jgi:hypothetical protein